MLFKQKENEEILSLKKKIKSIEDDLYFLKNPCKYHTGEKVDLYSCVGFGVRNHMGIYTIIDIRKVTTRFSFSSLSTCTYEYELISSDLKHKTIMQEWQVSNDISLYFEKHEDKKKK